MPKEVTASSGIDVIAHALEAFMGTEASPISDALAIKALKLAMEYLPRAYENGNDMEAREQMMFACIMAAVAFNTAGLGYIHAISHQLGGFYNTTHGNINAVLLPYIVEFNALSLPDDRIMKICRAMNLNAANKTHGVDLIVKSLMALSTNLGIPSHLKDMGLESEDIEALSRNALKDIAGLTNPRKGDLQDVMNIMNQAL
jgi:Alcohol dehydrogenase, class IV